MRVPSPSGVEHTLGAPRSYRTSSRAPRRCLRR
jgi:hypothetical protein